MNEHIKLLIMKAGGIICSDVATGTVEKIDYLRFDAEKFAELIVRECMDQVAEFSRLTKAYQKQGIDPEIDVTKEVLKNFEFTRFPRS